MTTATHAWTRLAEGLVPELAEHAPAHDRKGTFVRESFALLRKHRMMSMLVPVELGGGGASFADAANALRVLAHGCASTALALSMHTHVVAAAVWKHRQGKPTAPLLRRIAEEQLVLVSTGGTDWIDSVGTLRRVDGGYRLDARKVFASGSPEAAMLVTSARFEDPERGARVLHFALPFGAEGVRALDDWDTLGMRGTGSCTVLLEDVFVPDAAVQVARPQGEWHAAWSVVLRVAPPLYMAPYLGVAERACAIARRGSEARVASRAGAMENELLAARLAWRASVDAAQDLAFTPSLEAASAQLACKTLTHRSCRAAVDAAMVTAGGTGFFRRLPLEACFRDVQGGHFHPLPEDRQVLFSGRLALDHDPIRSVPLATATPAPAPRVA